MGQNQSSAGGLLTKIVVVLVVIIVLFNIITGATIQEIGIPFLFTIKFGNKPTEQPTAAPPTSIQATQIPAVPISPTSAPPSAPEFVSQTPYSDCANRPAGSVCVKYSDGYIWLVYDSIIGWVDGGSWEGRNVAVAQGSRADYHHVLGTLLVKEVPKK
jgi:hypothetical protein